MSLSLNDRLARLARGYPPAGAGGPRRTADLPCADDRQFEVDSPPRAPRRRKPPPSLESILPGEELRTDRGVCWQHERPLDRWPGIEEGLAERLTAMLAGPAPDDLARDPGWIGWRDRGIDSGLFLDLETTGLAATPVFLCGLLSARRGEMTFRLILARDYSEEAALLEVVAAEMARRPVVITFNGKSYDLPFLLERAGRLRTTPCRPAGHLDLVHPARRRWSGLLPDCRLKTLESRVLGRYRGGDIDGSLIPETYHRYIRDRDPRPLVRVMAHNLHDLYTLAELTVRTAGTPVPVPKTAGKLPDI